MKKYMLLMACICGIVILLVVWRGYTRELQLDGNGVGIIKIFRGTDGKEILIADQDKVGDILALLNQIQYQYPYQNNKKGYYFMMSFVDKEGSNMRGKEIVVIDNKNISFSFFSYKVENPEVLKELMDIIKFD